MKTILPAFIVVTLLLFFVNMPNLRAQILVSFTLQPDACQQCNGQATAIVTGGVLPYTYSWSNGVSGSVNGNLCSGVYEISVSDATGQTAVANCVIENSNEIIFTLPQAVPVVGTCIGGCGTFWDAIYAPAGYVTYQWNDGSIYNTPEYVAGFPGIYCVTVTDAAGCTGSACTTKLGVNIICNENNCDAPCSSQLSVSVLGTPPYSYQWSTGVTDTNLISGLCPGIYKVTVSDANGYSASVSEGIHNAEWLQYLLMGGSVFCPGGDIYIPINLPYESCIWNDGVNSCSRTLTEAISYSVTVTDTIGCRFHAGVLPKYSTSYPLYIGGIKVLTANHLCTTLHVDYYGNSAYAWSNGEATKEIEVCSPGIYCVTATASGGCTDTECVTVTQITGIETADSYAQNEVTVYAAYGYNAATVFWQQQNTAQQTAVFTLFDIWGRPIISQTITANAATPLVLPQSCTKGIYLWQLQLSNGQFRASGKVFLP